MGFQAIKNNLPWWSKIGFKLLLAKLPFKYAIWKKLGIFNNGPMDKPDYALNVFNAHLNRAKVPDAFTCLELGPGDSLFSVLLAYANGAARIYLVDVGDFASRDLSAYQQLAEWLERQGYRTPKPFANIEEMLRNCNADYITNGIKGLGSVPSCSVDLVWSQAVLEHVRKSEFVLLANELRRILKPSGIASHVVDLRDHLNCALNNLRFSESIWESDFFAKSGFYTNRIRFLEMQRTFQQSGFEVTVLEKTVWPTLPTPKTKLNERFRSLPEADLLVSTFQMLLSPSPTLLQNESKLVGASSATGSK